MKYTNSVLSTLIASFCVIIFLNTQANMYHHWSRPYRDGCKTFGDPCTCSSGSPSKGFCFPGVQSKPGDELYCDCSSDVYSEDELLDIMIRRYAEGKGIVDKKLISRTSLILKKIVEITGPKPVNTFKDERLKSLLDELKLAIRIEKSLIHYIPSDSVCAYPDQECPCLNSGRKGICAATRQANEQDIKLTCHCY